MACGRFSLQGPRKRVSKSRDHILARGICRAARCARSAGPERISCTHTGAQNKVVSVWIVDKRTPSGMGGGARWEAVVDLCRKDASALTRLKHPAIVKVRTLAYSCALEEM